MGIHKRRRRLSFWPAHKADLPLLSLCMPYFFVLAWTAMKIERGNSVGGIITQRLRRSQKPTTIENFIIGNKLLKELLAEAEKSSGLLDLDELGAEDSFGLSFK